MQEIDVIKDNRDQKRRINLSLQKKNSFTNNTKFQSLAQATIAPTLFAWIKLLEFYQYTYVFKKLFVTSSKNTPQ